VCVGGGHSSHIHTSITLQERVNWKINCPIPCMNTACLRTRVWLSTGRMYAKLGILNGCYFQSSEGSSARASGACGCTGTCVWAYMQEVWVKRRSEIQQCAHALILAWVNVLCVCVCVRELVICIECTSFVLSPLPFVAW
jgi:hypothetical protein